MKKLLLTAFLLTAIGLTSMAQTGIYFGGITDRVYRKTGFVIRPEIGFGYDDGFNTFYYAVQVDFGYQITPCIYVGGGLGSDIGTRKRYDYYSGYYGRVFGAPLYADFRWYWFKGESSPFLEVNTGACFVSGYYNDRICFLFTPSIGFDIKNFDIKVGSPDFEGIVFTLGYNIIIH